MKDAVLRGIVLALGLIILSSCSKEISTEIRWASSLEEAFQIASEKNQPVIAEFWSDG